jgi:hypothetical protein
MNQISRQCGQPFVFIPGEAIFDSDVLTLDKACVFQTLTERSEELWGVAGRPGVEDPDHRHRLGLPRPRHERPRHGRAAEHGYQSPPSDGDCHTLLPRKVRKGNASETSIGWSHRWGFSH